LARNGYLPTREILTTVGAVQVRVPKVHDRTGCGIEFNSVLAHKLIRTTYALLARREPCRDSGCDYEVASVA